jgi:hypothetical protein
MVDWLKVAIIGTLGCNQPIDDKQQIASMRIA